MTYCCPELTGITDWSLTGVSNEQEAEEGDPSAVAVAGAQLLLQRGEDRKEACSDV